MVKRLGLAAFMAAMIGLAACRTGNEADGVGGSTGGNGGGGAGGPLVDVTPSYTQIRALKVCDDIPAKEVETVMGAKVSRDPEDFSLEGRDSGCYYPFGRSNNKSIYVFISLGTTLMYEFNRESKIEMVESAGLGDEAFTKTTEDDQELWVLLNGKATIIVGMVNFDLDKAKVLTNFAIKIAPEK